MAQSQYNFKIEDELKDEAELLSKDFESKQEFLIALLESYKAHKNNVVDVDIDMSKYESINTQTKSLLAEAFKHIIYTVQQNTTLTKQQLISVDKDKKLIADEREEFKTQIKTLEANCNQKVLDAQKLHKEEQETKDIQIAKNEDLHKQKLKQLIDSELKIKDIQTELEQVKLIAKQVEMIANENSFLRKEISDSNAFSQAKTEATASKIKEFTDLLAEKEKELYRASIELKNLEKVVETLEVNLEKVKLESKDKDLEMKNLEKENIVLSTKLEMMNTKEKED